MSEDQKLKQSVLDQLRWEPSVEAAHIGVTAKDGVITLMGHVDNYAEKFAAETATRRVKNVKAVAEEIEVRLPFSATKHGDEEIASSAASQLKWDSSIPANAVKAKVEKGWVTLTGEVDWHFQRDAAMEAVRNLWGVTSVTNNITIKAKPNASAIRESIVTALDRSWMNPARIDVTADGGKVTLSGKVDSWYERSEAASAAWAAPGTTTVENNIYVN